MEVQGGKKFLAVGFFNAAGYSELTYIVVIRIKGSLTYRDMFRNLCIELFVTFPGKPCRGVTRRDKRK